VNLENGKIDKHACNLGSKFRSANFLHEHEDATANVLLIVRVFLNYSRQDRHGLLEETSSLCIALHGSHVCLLRHGLLSLRHRLRCHGHRLLCWHLLTLVLLHGTRLLLLLLLVLLALALVIALVLALALSLAALGVVSTLVLTGVRRMLPELLGSLSVRLLLLEVSILEEQAQQAHNFVRILEVLNAARILSLVALEVLLVLLHLVSHVTVLLNLVVVDIERVVVDLVSAQHAFGRAGLVGCLKAHEGEWLLLLLGWEQLE